MAKRYLKTMVPRLKTSNPNVQVSANKGSSIAEPLRPIFAFLTAVLPTVVSVDEALPAVVLRVRVVFTSLDDRALRKAKTKITRLI